MVKTSRWLVKKAPHSLWPIVWWWTSRKKSLMIAGPGPCTSFFNGHNSITVMLHQSDQFNSLVTHNPHSLKVKKPMFSSVMAGKKTHILWNHSKRGSTPDCPNSKPPFFIYIKISRIFPWVFLWKTQLWLCHHSGGRFPRRASTFRAEERWGRGEKKGPSLEESHGKHGKIWGLPGLNT